MHIQNADRAVLQTDGIVRRVDPVGRELEVAVAGTPVNFDVRTDCAITLRGERVKLRLLQPRDRVRISYAWVEGVRVAGAVDVQPGEQPTS
jgi:hypothetical protein